ncbi:MAG: hypothetical protein P8X42_04160 [Calditrichaceae bacterium]
MYIDERIDPDTGQQIDGAVDWNGDEQIDILEWTNFITHKVIKGTVAYNWVGIDTVERFNLKLLDQQAALSADYQSKGLGLWDFTYAPPDKQNSRWFNYLFDGSITNNAETYNSLNINNHTYYPYLPGGGTKRYTNNGFIWVGGRDWKMGSYTAGVDCSGLVVRCASYNNTPYVLENRAKSILTDDKVDVWNRAGAVDYRCDGENYGLALDKNSWLLNNPRYLIPGDILISGGHVVLVLYITYKDDDRQVSDRSDKVVVIEATQGGNNRWRVMNTNTWKDIVGNYATRRLKTKD